MSGPRAIVIGSGIGGSAAVALLAHAGIPATLVEKNRRVGGSCSGYEKQGFHVDIGTHMFCRGPKGPLGEVLRRVGHPSAIDFRRTRDIAELRSPQRAGEPKRGDGVRRLAVPADLHRVPYFLAQLAREIRLTPRDAARAARLFTQILTMSDEEVRAWDHRTLDEFTELYIGDSAMVGIFGLLLGLYFILPHWEVSAGESLWCFRRMVRDNALSYPKGGSIAVPNAYARIAEEMGAEVRLGAGVRKILVDDGGSSPRGRGVRGVELEDGTTLPADIVISTSSLRTTVLRLVGAEHFPEDYVDRVRAIRGSMIAAQVKIGLNKKLVHAGALVGGVGRRANDVDLSSVKTPEMKAMFVAVSQGKVPPIVPFYCPVPTNFDPDLAPPGHQLLTACSVAPTTDVSLVDPAPDWEEAIMRALRKVIPRLDDHTVFVDRFSTAFIEKWIGKEFGPAVSTAQTPDQVGARRPPVFTPIRGLYFAGCNAGARGVGTELAAASAMECVERILADLGRPVPAGEARAEWGWAPRTAAALVARATRIDP